MLKTALIAVAVLAVASPGLAVAKSAKKAEEAALLARTTGKSRVKVRR